MNHPLRLLEIDQGSIKGHAFFHNMQEQEPEKHILVLFIITRFKSWIGEVTPVNII